MNSYRITGSAGTTRWMRAGILSAVDAQLCVRYNNLENARAVLAEIQKGGGQ